jgi:MFS family permease
LFLARGLRLFAFGALSIVLVLYLAERGLSEGRIGLLLTATLLGDTALSVWITTRADRLGRRKMLILGAAVMTVAGAIFAMTGDFVLLLVTATLGVLSPSGNEVGPFLPIEQAALSQLVEDSLRTRVFARYSLAGSLATALGALAGGAATSALHDRGGLTLLASYQAVLFGYAAVGLAMLLVFSRLGSAVEAPAPAARRSLLGLSRSAGTVIRLSALFAVDSFGGGFVVQSLLAYWFHLRFGTEPGVLGAIFFTANLLAGFSALLAARIAARIGLVRTMVFTHLPSNALLLVVPLMPTAELAILVLLLRFSISQMDVPTRQSYVMAVVPPEERSAAAGVTGVARSTGASLSPFLGALCLSSPALASLPFFLAGSLKILYDLLLYRSFAAIRPPEESPQPERSAPGRASEERARTEEDTSRGASSAGGGAPAHQKEA